LLQAGRNDDYMYAKVAGADMQRQGFNGDQGSAPPPVLGQDPTAVGPYTPRPITTDE